MLQTMNGTPVNKAVIEFAMQETCTRTDSKLVAGFLRMESTSENLWKIEDFMHEINRDEEGERAFEIVKKLIEKLEQNSEVTTGFANDRVREIMVAEGFQHRHNPAGMSDDGASDTFFG